jgi:hypothetical protein
MRTLWLKTAKKTGFLAFFTAISAKKVLIPCIFRGLRPLGATFHLGEHEKPAISGAKMLIPRISLRQRFLAFCYAWAGRWHRKE